MKRSVSDVNGELTANSALCVRMSWGSLVEAPDTLNGSQAKEVTQHYCCHSANGYINRGCLLSIDLSSSRYT